VGSNPAAPTNFLFPPNSAFSVITGLDPVICVSVPVDVSDTDEHGWTRMNTDPQTPPLDGEGQGGVEALQFNLRRRSFSSATSVIPAQAGIQGRQGWTPAFAGVTMNWRNSESLTPCTFSSP
jgi:hypothetical protein